MLRYFSLHAFFNKRNAKHHAVGSPPSGELEGAITLRWLLRRGSPLPIPNRVVKPACADGTAVMWESMSSPFFSEPCLFRQGSFFLQWSDVFALRARFVAFLFKNPVSLETGFFVYIPEAQRASSS
jgi:hypothetical protein